MPTLSLSPRPVRFGATIAAAALTALSFGALSTPAEAAGGGYYAFDLAQPAARAKMPLKGVVVSCSETRCAAPKAATAPATMCATVARKIGRVTSFAVGGEAFDAAAIARCNGEG